MLSNYLINILVGIGLSKNAVAEFYLIWKV